MNEVSGTRNTLQVGWGAIACDCAVPDTFGVSPTTVPASAPTAAGYSIHTPRPCTEDIWAAANEQVIAGTARVVPVSEFLHAAESFTDRLDKLPPHRLRRLPISAFALAASVRAAQGRPRDAAKFRAWQRRVAAQTRPRPRTRKSGAQQRHRQVARRARTRNKSPATRGGDCDSDGDGDGGSDPLAALPLLRAPPLLPSGGERKATHICSLMGPTQVASALTPLRTPRRGKSTR